MGVGRPARGDHGSPAQRAIIRCFAAGGILRGNGALAMVATEEKRARAWRRARTRAEPVARVEVLSRFDEGLRPQNKKPHQVNDGVSFGKQSKTTRQVSNFL